MRRSPRLIARLRSIAAERIQRMEAAAQQLGHAPEDEKALAELRRELHTLKGEARVVGFVGVADVVHAIETLLGQEPTPDKIKRLLKGLDLAAELLEREPGPAPEAEAFAAEQEAAEESSASPERARESTDAPGLPEASAPPIISSNAATQHVPSGARQPEKRVRVSEERLQRLSAIAEMERLARGEHLEAIVGLERALADIEIQRRLLRKRVLKDPKVVPMLERLDSVVDRVSGGLSHLRRSDLDARIRLERLEALVHELRMVPARSLLGGVGRAVRTMAAGSGKQVRAAIQGAGTEADRAVLDAMADPLVHLLRNAIDHGIESGEQRLAAGKPLIGEILVAVRNEGSMLELTVADDGRGLDHGRIASRALERELVTEDELTEMSPEAIGQLIFLPGFSTRQGVSATSGRGIGLDVVATSARELGGDVVVGPRPGGGTIFTVSVPASLIATEAVIVSVGESLFAFDCSWVVSMTDRSAHEVEQVTGHETIRIDERPTRLRHLADLLSLPRPPPSRDRNPILIVGRGDTHLALNVEELVGEERLVRREQGLFLSGLELLRGTALLADGRIAMILDVPGLIQAGNEVGGSVRTTRRRRVLVVDDSELLRTLVAQVVEGMGHETVQAGDGLAGLERAIEIGPDLIFTDLEMPRMDGFELVEAARKERELQHVPIVVFSTRGSDEDRERAAMLGADAYIVKGELNQEAIRRAVTRFLGARAR